MSSFANILFVLFCEAWSLSAWLFWLICDKLLAGVNVQLTTGLAVGVRRRGHVFFDGVQYGEAHRFQAAQLLRPSTARRLQEHPSTCFAQAVRSASLDSPMLVSALQMMARKRTVGYLGEENAFQLCIWAPTSAPASSSSLLPVLVYFHGGAHVFGSKDMSMSSGAALARRGCIVVSAAYRLGVLGYLTAPGVVSNLGARDQLLALQWVAANIQKFGGDAKNITVGGQSAGSISAASLLAVDGVVPRNGEAAAAPGGGGGGLVSKAFLCSGTGQHIQTKAQARAVLALFGKHAGIPLLVASSGASYSSSAGKIVEHLKQLPLACLLSLQKSVEDEITLLYRRCEHNGLMPFSSTIDDDLFPANPTKSFRERELGLPCLLGTTEHEYTFFTALAPSSKMAKNWHPIDDSKIRNRMQQWTSAEKNSEEMINKVLRAYQSGGFESKFKTHPLWNAVNGDYVFRVPTERLASANTIIGSRSWVFCFAEPSGLLDRLQAAHCIDLHYWFGTVLSFPFLAGFPSGGKLALQDHCVGILVEFLQRRDLASAPAASFESSSSRLWRPWNDDERPTYYLAAGKGGLRCNEDDAAMRSWEQIFAVMESEV